MKSPTWLLDHRRDVYSQTGEDGIIETILGLIPDRDRWSVEFGAWDGELYSNTRCLIERAEYSAVFIEANPAKFAELQDKFGDRPNVIGLNRLVGFSAEDGLDSILHATPVPLRFDFLSIDIDGNDYHAWKAINQYRPKVVCIEFNPTVPTEVPFVQPPDQDVSQGCGLSPLVALGKEKGYELVAVLLFNAFFVDRAYYARFEIADNRPETLRTDLSRITYLFAGYDGRVLLHGFKRLPWHSLPIDETALQPLPTFLQKFPDHYSRLEAVAFDLWFRPKQLFMNVLANVLRSIRRPRSSSTKGR